MLDAAPTHGHNASKLQNVHEVHNIRKHTGVTACAKISWLLQGPVLTIQGLAPPCRASANVLQRASKTSQMESSAAAGSLARLGHFRRRQASTFLQAAASDAPEPAMAASCQTDAGSAPTCRSKILSIAPVNGMPD